MIQLPNHLIEQYRVHSIKRGIENKDFADYLKWVRYFLDYCEKYCVSGDEEQRIHLFLEKLKEKKQAEARRRQAYQAVSLYFEMLKQGAVAQPTNHSPRMPASPKEQAPERIEQQQPVYMARKSYYSVVGYEEKSDSAEWDAVLAALAGEIKVRHYSRKTLKTYAHWSRQFQRYLKNKMPQELTDDDVKQYLTYLAVKCNVAASTQNQAFLIG